MQQDYRAILCFDFDGTLVDRETDEGALLELMDIVGDLRDRGAAWVINTGRSLFQTLEGLTQHRITLVPDFIVAREGEIFQRSQFNRWVDVGDWNERRTKDHKKLYRSKDKFFREIQQLVAGETKIKWVSDAHEPAGLVCNDEEEMTDICKWLDEQLVEHPELRYHRNSIYLRFSHHAYSKGSALAELGSVLSVPADHRFVAGDNHNDLSMLKEQVALNLACPANSIAEVQAAVQEAQGFISEHESTRGCIDALDYYFYR